MISENEVFIGSKGVYSVEKEQKFKELAKALIEFAHENLPPDAHIVVNHTSAYIVESIVELKYL